MNFGKEFDKLFLSGFKDKVDACLGNYFNDHTQMLLAQETVPILMNWNVPWTVLKMADVC